MSMFLTIMEFNDLSKIPNAPKGHKESLLSKVQTKDGLEEPVEQPKVALKNYSADGKAVLTIYLDQSDFLAGMGPNDTLTFKRVQ